MIEIYEGDITKLEVEAIVNAANEQLSHGGGVAKAILDAAGKEVNEESKEIISKKGALKIGEPVFTSSGRLGERGVNFIIHVVGPKGTKEDILEKTLKNVFGLAKTLGVKTIALPAISCGIFGFDKNVGSKLIYDISKNYEEDFEKIILCSIDKEIIGYWNKENEERRDN